MLKKNCYYNSTSCILMVTHLSRCCIHTPVSEWGNLRGAAPRELGARRVGCAK